MTNRIHDLITVAIKGKLTSKERVELGTYKARYRESSEMVEVPAAPDFITDEIAFWSLNLDDAFRTLDLVFKKVKGNLTEAELIELTSITENSPNKRVPIEESMATEKKFI